MAAPDLKASAAARPRLIRNAYDVLVVGAGFDGAVMAERLASDGGKLGQALAAYRRLPQRLNRSSAACVAEAASEG